MARGKFIVIEGGEGSGKTTAIEALKTRFAGAPVIFSREPGGTPYAEKIRHLALKDDDARLADGTSIFLLMWAARRDHMEVLIKPALERGDHVICDRFAASSWAFNVRGQNQPQLAPLFSTMEEAVLGEIVPDLYIFLDVDPVVGIERRQKNSLIDNHFDEQEFAFHHTVREGYKEFFRTHPHRTVDAGAPKEEVAQHVCRIVQELTGLA